MRGISKWMVFVAVLFLAVPLQAQELGSVFGSICENGVCRLQQGPVIQAVTQPVRSATRIASGVVRRSGAVVSGVSSPFSQCGPNGCQPVRRMRFFFR